MKGRTKMKNSLKKNLGNLAINMGKHAVGKCMIQECLILKSQMHLRQK